MKFKQTKEMEQIAWNLIAKIISQNPKLLEKLTEESEEYEVNN